MYCSVIVAHLMCYRGTCLVLCVLLFEFSFAHLIVSLIITCINIRITLFLPKISFLTVLLTVERRGQVVRLPDL